jgi:uncharacterized protein (DUF58 family)
VKKLPTRRALVFVGVGALLVVVGSTAQAGWLFVLAAVVIGVLATSLVSGARLSECEFARTLPARARVGDEVPVAISLRNNNLRRWLPGHRVIDSFPAFESTTFACDGLSPGASAEVRIQRTAARRGIHRGGEMVVTSGWPFGLTRSKRRMKVGGRITVVPQWVELRSFAPLETWSASSDSERFAARSGSGEQFLGVREYRAGDDTRYIHWRSSARRGELVVREYEDELSQRVAVVLSGSDYGTPPDSSYEALVSAAASVANYCLRRGLRVELIRAGDHEAERLPTANWNEVLDWLATARPADAPLLPLVRAALNAGEQPGAVVLFTSTDHSGTQVENATGLIRRRGALPVLISADATTWDPEVSAVERPRPVACPTRTLVKERALAECLNA